MTMLISLRPKKNLKNFVSCIYKHQQIKIFECALIFCMIYVKLLKRVVKPMPYQNTYNIVTTRKYILSEERKRVESLTINPLVGYICTQFMWGMKSGLLVLLALVFVCVSITQNRKTF